MTGPAPESSAGPGHRRTSAAGPGLRIAALEPYFGGSHRQFLQGLQRHSRHRIELFTMPPRLWKWRVRGSALQLARALNEAGSFDALLCSDFVNVADLRALVTPDLRARPVLYYLHENQLSYPLSPDEQLDPYFGFTNVLSCLSAEAVAFNSNFHCREFLARLPGFLPRLPDYDRRWVVTTIGAKSEVLPLGLDLQELDRHRPTSSPHAAAPGTPRSPAGRPPRRILWNHRWEFDKDPERFFRALDQLVERKVPFRVDVVGESFARQPEVFEKARERLGPRIGQFGYVESREDYIRLLWKSDIVVSTAKQEFFGVAMAEAVWCGAWPIAPKGLVYEDLYGGTGASQHLYRDDDELVKLLEKALTAEKLEAGPVLRQRLAHHEWHRVADRFDERFEALVAGAPRPSRR